MRSGSLSMSTRRGLLVVMVAALLCGASGLQGLRAQDPPDGMKFATERAMVLWTVTGAKSADFESAWAAIKAKLSASDKPDLKELGASISILKMAAPAGGAEVLYVFDMNPPSKTLSYEPVKILYAPGFMERAEADAVLEKLKGSIVSINPFPLSKVGG